MPSLRGCTNEAHSQGVGVNQAAAFVVRYAPSEAQRRGFTGVTMTKVAEFHTTGIEDVDELVFHNQSECPIGQEIMKKGTAAAGQGYFRTLCIKCKGIEDGWEGNRPL
jgi:hypothetical protein